MKSIIKLPLSSLLSEDNLTEYRRVKEISESEIQFIVANVSTNLVWHTKSNCFKFWKLEVQSHLVKSSDKIVLSEYPEQYAYIASEWKNNSNEIVILLEMCH